MTAIVAILTVHNAAPTLARVLERLQDNAIQVYAIDHGSTDATPAILKRHLGRPIAEIAHKPFDGVFRLREQMQWKTELARRIEADWLIHIDADEILESPRADESLRSMIERMDAAGFDVIDCDEFMFVPASEGEQHGKDFPSTMQHYYYFSREGLANHRVFRKRSGAPEWANTGGHKLALSNRRLAPEKLRKRHYIGLSLNALRAQYLSRVFDAEELQKGWHRNRVATSTGFIVAPPPDRLFHLERDGWHTDRPEAKHLIFHQPKAYTPPAFHTSTDHHPPMPFIIGTGRSGTTLLRLLLDAHPQLAIPPETLWLPQAITVLTSDPADIPALRQALTGHMHWKDMGINDGELERIFKRHNVKWPFDTLRNIYTAYAERFQATRIGDKTPLHGTAMAKIARAFPEAYFIHVIRDGRDVALSYRDKWFTPANSIPELATFWAWNIREIRQTAQFMPHYMEVRYEQLAAEPEAVLQTIGQFIQLPFHADQLRAHESAPARLAEMQNVQRPDGLFLPAERRRSVFAETHHPPNTSRIGRWQTEMTAKEIGDFESIAGNLLADLGY